MSEHDIDINWLNWHEQDKVSEELSLLVFSYFQLFGQLYFRHIVIHSVKKNTKLPWLCNQTLTGLSDSHGHFSFRGLCTYGLLMLRFLATGEVSTSWSVFTCLTFLCLVHKLCGLAFCPHINGIWGPHKWRFPRVWKTLARVKILKNLFYSVSL